MTLATQEVKCPHCATVLGALKTKTGEVRPIMEGMAAFQLSEAKTLTCPGCGQEVPIK